MTGRTIRPYHCHVCPEHFFKLKRGSFCLLVAATLLFLKYSVSVCCSDAYTRGECFVALPFSHVVLPYASKSQMNIEG